MSRSSHSRFSLDPLWQTGNVIKAVMLRDMRTRFFNHGLGFLLVPLWPLAHLVVLLVIFSAMGRAAPYGDSLNIFFATGLIPTLSFMYISRFMSYSLLFNRPMLSFPVVKPVDLLVGRAILEIIASFLMIVLLVVILIGMGDDPFPYDPVAAVSSLLATYLLAIGVGMVMGIIAMRANFVITVYALSLIAVYLLSGTMFVVSALPAQVAAALSWNPVLHAVEWMRVAFFPGYPDQILDKAYLVGFGVAMLFLGLAMERVDRQGLLQR